MNITSSYICMCVCVCVCVCVYRLVQQFWNKKIPLVWACIKDAQKLDSTNYTKSICLVTFLESLSFQFFLLLFDLLKSARAELHVWRLVWTSIEEFFKFLTGLFPLASLVAHCKWLWVFTMTGLGEESNGNLQGGHFNGDNFAKTSVSNTWVKIPVLFLSNNLRLAWMPPNMIRWFIICVSFWLKIFFQLFFLGVIFVLGIHLDCSLVLWWHLIDRYIICSNNLFQFRSKRHNKWVWLVIRLSQVGQFCKRCTHNSQNFAWPQVCEWYTSFKRVKYKKIFVHV